MNVVLFMADIALERLITLSAVIKGLRIFTMKFSADFLPANSDEHITIQIE
jgi:hypothetical protein